MKFWLLVILFTTHNGEEIYIDGWHPTQQQSLEVCEQRKAFLEKTMESYEDDLPNKIASYTVECKEYNWTGN
jgi:uncharacterized protein CbrC (UPF0167 family)